MKKPRKVSLYVKCQTNDNKNNNNNNCSSKKRKSFYELSLSLIFSLWCLIFLFYSRLGLSHGNEGNLFAIAYFFNDPFRIWDFFFQFCCLFIGSWILVNTLFLNYPFSAFKLLSNPFPMFLFCIYIFLKLC